MVYLIDRDSLGQFNPTNNDQIVQSLPGPSNGLWGSPALWRNNLYTGIVPQLMDFLGWLVWEVVQEVVPIVPEGQCQVRGLRNDSTVSGKHCSTVNREVQRCRPTRMFSWLARAEFLPECPEKNVPLRDQQKPGYSGAAWEG